MNVCKTKLTFLAYFGMHTENSNPNYMCMYFFFFVGMHKNVHVSIIKSDIRVNMYLSIQTESKKELHL